MNGRALAWIFCGSGGYDTANTVHFSEFWIGVFIKPTLESQVLLDVFFIYEVWWDYLSYSNLNSFLACFQVKSVNSLLKGLTQSMLNLF